MHSFEPFSPWKEERPLNSPKNCWRTWRTGEPTRSWIRKVAYCCWFVGSRKAKALTDILVKNATYTLKVVKVIFAITESSQNPDSDAEAKLQQVNWDNESLLLFVGRLIANKVSILLSLIHPLTIVLSINLMLHLFIDWPLCFIN